MFFNGILAITEHKEQVRCLHLYNHTAFRKTWNETRLQKLQCYTAARLIHAGCHCKLRCSEQCIHSCSDAISFPVKENVPLMATR